MNLAIPEQFAAFANEHRGMLMTWALRYCPDYHTAEEIVQDALIRAHRSYPHFRGQCSVKTWVLGIIRNLSFNRYHFERRRGADRRLSLDMPFDDTDPGSRRLADVIADPGSSVHAEIELTEAVATIERFRTRLAPKHQQILTMRIERGMAYEDIAAELGIDCGTVKSRLSRARERLMASLDAAA